MVTCVRGTCSREAVAGLGYDPVARSLWLMDLPGDDHEVLALCAGHADNLVVPDWWTSHDQRSGEPRLWSLAPEPPAAEGPAPAPTRLDHERARRETEVEVLALFDDVETAATDAVEEVDAPEPSVEVGARGSLIPGVTDDAVGEELTVGERTPLLARAFRASRVG